jgi:hypothetical protein
MPYTSRRTQLVIVGLAIALVLSLGATAAMAVVWSRDRDANRVALANDATRIHGLEARFSSPSAQPSIAPTATAAQPTESATSSAPAAPPVYPHLTDTLDSLGNDFPNQVTVGAVNLKAGTVITLKASVSDPLNRHLEYQFWRGDVPSQVLLCAWGASSCTLTVPTCSTPTGSCGVHVLIAVRDQDAVHRLTNCYRLEPCDDMMSAWYNSEPR